MNVKDSQLISYINKHYKELLDELKDINSFERFSCEENAVLRKAVKMDLFQIGENFGKLSTEIKGKLNKRNIKGSVVSEGKVKTSSRVNSSRVRLFLYMDCFKNQFHCEFIILHKKTTTLRAFQWGLKLV